MNSYYNYFSRLKYFFYFLYLQLFNYFMNKKKLIILTLLTLFYSCKFEKIKVYEEENIIQVDTFNIEQIKIETH